MRRCGRSGPRKRTANREQINKWQTAFYAALGGLEGLQKQSAGRPRRIAAQGRSGTGAVGRARKETDPRHRRGERPIFYFNIGERPTFLLYFFFAARKTRFASSGFRVRRTERPGPFPSRANVFSTMVSPPSVKPRLHMLRKVFRSVNPHIAVGPAAMPRGPVVPVFVHR